MEDQELVIGGVYRHFKGNHYLVTGLGRHTETGQELVAYNSLIEDVPPRMWLRPKEMFLGLNEQGIWRFELVAQSLRQWALGQNLRVIPQTTPA